MSQSPITDPLMNHPNVRAAHEAEDNIPESGEVVNTSTAIRDKLIFVLAVFPKLSSTMLQIGLGTSVSPSEWRPILASLIQEGIIVVDSVTYLSTVQRWQTYRIHRLREDIFEAVRRQYNIVH